MDVYIISGFMGSGKTTLINHILPSFDDRTALIINDDGDARLDPAYEEKLPVEYVLGGCICCTLIMKFREAVQAVAQNEEVDRIIIEAAGVGKASDVVKAIEQLQSEGFDLTIRDITTCVDVCDFGVFAHGLGDFYMDQVTTAKRILLTHRDLLEDPEEETEALDEIRKENPNAQIIDTMHTFDV